MDTGVAALTNGSGSVTTGPVARSLADRLEDPEVASSLHVLLDNAATLALAVQSIDGLVRRGEVITDTIGAGVREVLPALGNLEEVAAQAQAVTSRAPELFGAFEALVASGMLSPRVLDLLGHLAGALVEGAEKAKANGTSVNGVVPAVRALRDPQVARGLGFLVEVARALGKDL